MALTLNNFPKLTPALRSKAAYTPSHYQFTYMNEGIKNMLKTEKLIDNSSVNVKSILKLTDSKGIWHPEEYNLTAVQVCSINNPSVLFGENGLVSTYSTLGIAIEWTAREANVRGIFPVGELTADETEPIRFSKKIEFNPHTLRGTLSLKTILYLENYGGAKRNENHLAKITGTILGVLDETNVIIDGNGSVFPVVIEEKPGEPLWRVECNWGDPLEDAFVEENFCLFINKSNPVYKIMESDEGMMNSPVFREIMASTLQILITTVLMDKTCSLQELKSKNIESGCVAGVVSYLLHAFDWTANVEKPEELALQIRQSLDKRLGG